MKRLVLLFGLVALAATPAAAQQPPEPAINALSQMVQEAQGREAGALVQVYTLRAQLAVERKRADEAEAKLKASPAPAAPAPEDPAGPH